ncbi:G1/S-specific cyclin-E [Anabrus simplex]|uniref:G1/S-specific cyclin-E n=1 Tax=Anabrus simplex TaxID=316456 RepID=UPI0035A2B53B
MPLPTHHGTRPSLLKRKRTYSDEEQENNPPPCEPQGSHVLEQWDVPAECAQIMFSPDSIASSELCSENEPASGQQTPLDSEGSQSGNQCPIIHPPISCHERLSPMPLLNWADSKEVWELMCHKDIMSMGERDEEMFLKHPFLTARMRSILLDWLIEVCEVYKLHRETYHLTMDFIDRYLSIQSNIPKQQLQLIGITCLFIAAKVEEIYPPKIIEFAYVTDGACTESEILDKELVILKTLNWNLSPVTANNWLNMYLQFLTNIQHQEHGVETIGSPDTFLFPQYSGLTFVQTAQLLDLCMLDEGCLRFQYGTLAASAIYYVFNRETSLFVSGLQWSDIAECVQWMSAFAITLREESSDLTTLKYDTSWEDSTSCGLLKTVPRIVVDDSHNIQTHSVDMKLLEKAQERLELQANTASSPVSPTPGLLTPPSSHKKAPSSLSTLPDESNT